MVKLQTEMGIFKEGRSFDMSIAALNLAGQAHQGAKEGFHAYLRSLRRAGSNIAGLSGDQAMVKSIVKNLASKNPLPVYFEPHDAASDARVVITAKARPMFYMDQDYLVVSMPVGEKDDKPAKAGKSTKKAKTKAKPKSK
jgi:hypothetical protein